jgi:hypothetical protein
MVDTSIEMVEVINHFDSILADGRRVSTPACATCGDHCQSGIRTVMVVP